MEATWPSVSLADRRKNPFSSSVMEKSLTVIISFPIPEETERIDLALAFGEPTFLRTLEVVVGDMKVEKIILAVGQQVEAANLELPLVKNEVEFEGYQADTKVFVTGDIAHGDKTVVWAVKKGREAAMAIHQSLGGKA